MTVEAPASPAAPSSSDTPAPGTPAAPAPEGGAQAPTGDAGEAAPEGTPSEPSAESKGSLLGGEDQGGDDKGKPGQSEAAEIEITLPDGYTMDEKVLERFKPFAQELKLNGEQASKLAKFYADERGESLKEAEATLSQQADEWRKEIETDPDYGRKNLEETSAHAKRGVEWAGPKVRAMIVRYGLGNHPDLYRFFTRLGRATGDDDTFVSGSAGGSGKQTVEQRRDKMYPTMNADGTPKKGGKS